MLRCAPWWVALASLASLAAWPAHAQPAPAAADDAATGTAAATPPLVTAAEVEAVAASAPPPSAATPAADAPPLPEPPPSYRVPPPPPGARYPGMEDIGPGSHTPADPSELRLPIEVSTRLRVLSTDLEALSSRGGGSAANGLLSIVTGGLSIALGALQPDDAFSSFLFVFGTATILRGGVDMVVTPDPTTPALEYAHMPMRDLVEVRARLRHGERSLSDLADGYRLARILDGSLSLAAGVTIIPLVLVPNDFKFEGPLDVFVVVGAGISVLSGAISLLTPSEAERREAAYLGLRRRLEEDDAPEPRIRVGVSATRDGLGVRLGGRF